MKLRWRRIRASSVPTSGRRRRGGTMSSRGAIARWTSYPSRLRRGHVGDELGELLGRRAVRGADVVAARADAGAQALDQRESEHSPEAEAGIEMVAGAGAD